MPDISYDHYYWQNDLVRIMAPREDEWEAHYRDRYDCAARLPPQGDDP